LTRDPDADPAMSGAALAKQEVGVDPPPSRSAQVGSPPPDITSVLRAVANGAPGADDRLANLVYDPLRAIAHRQLQSERTGHTLQTTGLVHEAFLRLIDQRQADWSGRTHFFAVAARVMRRILVDYARKHRAARRGGAYRLVSLDDADVGAIAAAERADELIALDEALLRFEKLDPRACQVVECRFFGGLTEAETAETLGIAPRTVAREWVKARGWLYQELRGSDA
jgi:RNA polymerase sigma factor (TIGR02999 family)